MIKKFFALAIFTLALCTQAVVVREQDLAEMRQLATIAEPMHLTQVQVQSWWETLKTTAMSFLAPVVKSIKNSNVLKTLTAKVKQLVSKGTPVHTALGVAKRAGKMIVAKAKVAEKKVSDTAGKFMRGEAIKLKQVGSSKMKSITNKAVSAAVANARVVGTENGEEVSRQARSAAMKAAKKAVANVQQIQKDPKVYIDKVLKAGKGQLAATGVDSSAIESLLSDKMKTPEGIKQTVKGLSDVSKNMSKTVIEQLGTEFTLVPKFTDAIQGKDDEDDEEDEEEKEDDEDETDDEDDDYDSDED